MQRPRRQWLVVESDSLEAFVWFLVELAFALVALLAAIRWAVSANVDDLPLSGVVAAGAAGGIHGFRRWSSRGAAEEPSAGGHDPAAGSIERSAT